jgi:hypothetical protein
VDDLQARLEKLLADAEDCALIGKLATDARKRDLFNRLATDLRVTALDLQAMIALNRMEPDDDDERPKIGLNGVRDEFIGCEGRKPDRFL